MNNVNIDKYLVIRDMCSQLCYVIIDCYNNKDSIECKCYFIGIKFNELNMRMPLNKLYNLVKKIGYGNIKKLHYIDEFGHIQYPFKGIKFIIINDYMFIKYDSKEIIYKPDYVEFVRDGDLITFSMLDSRIDNELVDYINNFNKYITI